MKRLLCAILMLVLLIQAMPLNALAAAGHVLTEEKLAAAYALTGFGDSGVQGNAAYHKGMKPSTTWNAMQVSDWLDEMLDTYMFSVEDILFRASNKLVKLHEEDPAGYQRFTEDSDNAEAIAYMQQMYVDAEAQREEMRYQQDRINEQAGIIAELGRRLSEQDDALTDSDRVRLSAKIEAATADLQAARQEVADNADQWGINIELWQQVLDPAFEGQADEEFVGGPCGRSDRGAVYL